MTIIGGADGPTAYFHAGILGNMGWLNVFGAIIVLIIMIPNIIFALKHKDYKNRCTNKVMNVLEQIGRYGCIIFMIFNIGLSKFGFSSVEVFLAYLFLNAFLLLAYIILWIVYASGKSFFVEILLAVVPFCVFLLCGLTLWHIPLIICAVIFGVSHIYVTVKNSKMQ